MFAVFCTKDKTRSKWCGQIVYKVSKICHGHRDHIKVKSVEGSVGTEQLNSFKNDRQLLAIRKHPPDIITGAVGPGWATCKAGPESGMEGSLCSEVQCIMGLITWDPDDTHDWKRYLPATSLAVGDNAVLVFDLPYWQGCLDGVSHQVFYFSNIVKSDCNIVLWQRLLAWTRPFKMY